MTTWLVVIKHGHLIIITIAICSDFFSQDIMIVIIITMCWDFLLQVIMIVILSPPEVGMFHSFSARRRAGSWWLCSPVNNYHYHKYCFITVESLSSFIMQPCKWWWLTQNERNSNNQKFYWHLSTKFNPRSSVSKRKQSH